MITGAQIIEAMRALGIEHEPVNVALINIGTREVTVQWFPTNPNGTRTGARVTETHTVQWSE